MTRDKKLFIRIMSVVHNFHLNHINSNLLSFVPIGQLYYFCPVSSPSKVFKKDLMKFIEIHEKR